MENISISLNVFVSDDMNMCNKQVNPTVTLAGALPPGSNTQQVTAMLARIQNLGDKHEISEVCARQKLRTMIQQLLDEKYDQIDQACV